MFVSYTLLHSCRRRLTLWTLYDTSHNYPTLGLMYRLIRNYRLLMSSLTSRYLSQSSCNCSCANTMTRLNHCLYGHIPCLLHCYRYCRLQSAHRSHLMLMSLMCAVVHSSYCSHLARLSHYSVHSCHIPLYTRS